MKRHDVERALAALGYDYGRPQDQEQRRRDFRRVQSGTNFMSPELCGMIRLRSKPYVIIEFSLGEFLGDILLGATAVDCATQEKLYDDSKCLFSTDDLAGYLAELERKFK